MGCRSLPRVAPSVARSTAASPWRSCSRASAERPRPRAAGGGGAGVGGASRVRRAAAALLARRLSLHGVPRAERAAEPPAPRAHRRAPQDPTAPRSTRPLVLRLPRPDRPRPAATRERRARALLEVLSLCGQCHGEKYRDWRVGVHGKRTGDWNGKKRYLLCAHCHNPHTPRFSPIKPLPPPVGRARCAERDADHSAHRRPSFTP